MENLSAKNQNGGIFSGKYSGEQATDNLKFRFNAGSFFLSCGFLAGCQVFCYPQPYCRSLLIKSQAVNKENPGVKMGTNNLAVFIQTASDLHYG